MKTNKLLALTCMACVSLANACAEDAGAGTGGSASSGSDSPTSGNSSGSGDTSSASNSTGSSTTGGSIPLPLTVSSDFIPSGYMGDGATPHSVTMLPRTMSDPQDCGGDRSTPAIGTCYQITYMPVSGGMKWAGIFWQAPANNWGDQPGKAVETGATKLSVWAKGAAGGEVVTFGVGIQSAGKNFQDTFHQEASFTLTNEWKEYDVTLPGTYGPVLGAFSWSVAAPADGSSPSFSLDSIQWQQ